MNKRFIDLAPKIWHLVGLLNDCLKGETNPANGGFNTVVITKYTEYLRKLGEVAFILTDDDTSDYAYQIVSDVIRKELTCDEDFNTETMDALISMLERA